MADDFGALRKQRAQLHLRIRELELSLGNEISTKENFSNRYGDDAPRRYEDWRRDCVQLLHRLKARDEELKAQTDRIIRTDGAVEQFREVWQLLSTYPDMPDMVVMRERVRVFVRDTYGVFFKDPKGELDA